ncbi:MAG: response regulator [Pseudomonadota bacterium]
MAHHVLLIEDEPNILEAVRFVLSRAGWRVSCHSDGATAVEAVARTSPDVVVLDVMLPNRSGLDVLKDLRAQDDTADLPVLILTAKGQTKDRDQATHLGASAFMAKPFANSDMVERLQSLVGA